MLPAAGEMGDLRDISDMLVPREATLGLLTIYGDVTQRRIAEVREGDGWVVKIGRLVAEGDRIVGIRCVA